MIEFVRCHYVLVPYIIISFLFSIYFYGLIKKGSGKIFNINDITLNIFLSFSWPVHIFGLIYLKATGKLID